MLSEAISLRRLRFYENECRRGAADASDVVARTEFHKFEEAFNRKATELQAVCDALPNGTSQQTSSPVGAMLGGE